MPDGINVTFPHKYQFLFQPARYKVAYGGRASAKSWSFAKAAILRCYTETPNGKPHKIGCFREFQSSINDSVHALLKSQIGLMGLSPWFKVTDTYIESRTTGGVFIYKGLHNNLQSIKSMEGLTIAWVEEAQLVTKDSWDILVPTIREPGSEVWITFNQIEDTDATYQRFVANPPEGAVVVPVTWKDNDYFPDVLDTERRLWMKNDPDTYDWIWGLETRKISDAVIFKNRYVIESFEEPPEGTRLYHGVDWGFSDDPMFAVRCWEKDNVLYIDHESVGYHVEFEDMKALFFGGESADRKQTFPGIPTIGKWPVKGDSSRPETISYVKRNCNLMISPAEKWKGSVEDGIAHLKGFKRIVIHPRCKHMAREARLYCFKTDPRQVDEKGRPVVLPIVVDKHNHGWDANRYALDGFIQKRGKMGQWELLGRAG